MSYSWMKPYNMHQSLTDPTIRGIIGLNHDKVVTQCKYTFEKIELCSIQWHYFHVHSSYDWWALLVQTYQGWILRPVAPNVTQPNQDITTPMSKGWENASDKHCAEQTSTRPSEQWSPPGAFLWRQGLQQKNKSKKKSSTEIHVRTVPKFNWWNGLQTSQMNTNSTVD